MIESEKLNTNSSKYADDLPEKLRQISDALWDSAQRKDFEQMNLLLDKRQEILEVMSESKPLNDLQRRELTALSAADKYLMRQLSNELEWLDRRLTGVSKRRSAAAGYRTKTNGKTFLNRTG